MKYARVGLAATIMTVFAVSSAVAQDRERDRRSLDRSQSESWQGNRDQAFDGEHGYQTRRARGGSNAAQSRDTDGQTSDDQFVRFRFTRGHARFDIRCPANEQMRDCLQAGSEFIKQVSRVPDSGETRAGEVMRPESAPSTKQQ